MLLSSIWGASFLFMRIGAPVLGAVWLIFARLFFATAFLVGVAVWSRRAPGGFQHWRFFMVLAFFNSALPFVLLGHAATTLPAWLMGVLNATAPMWAALIGAVWLRAPITGRTALGLVLGMAGVALLAGVESLHLPSGGLGGIFSVLGAAFCYDIATHDTKSRAAPSVTPFANAYGSMAAGLLWLLPVLPFAPLPSSLSGAMPAGVVIGAVLGLGILCSGMAYLIYFRLVADIGATSTLTVTYLVPVFGILWGVLFLGESVGWHTLAGGLVVLAGTMLVTGFSPRKLLGPR